MSLNPKSYTEALERASRCPAKPRKPMNRGKGLSKCGPKLPSGPFQGSTSTGKPRKRLIGSSNRSKTTIDGDSARAVKAEMDDLVRKILPLVETCCFVCAAPDKHVELHPGHYVTRKVLALRWDWTRNVHRQCNPCNNEHNTNPAWYRGMLALDLGEDAVIELDRLKEENPRLEYTDLITIRDQLRDDLKTLNDN